MYFIYPQSAQDLRDDDDDDDNDDHCEIRDFVTSVRKSSASLTNLIFSKFHQNKIYYC